MKGSEHERVESFEVDGIGTRGGGMREEESSTKEEVGERSF